MDHPQCRDLLEEGYKLGYFILTDRDQALEVASDELMRIETYATTERKRMNNPETKHHTKIHNSPEQLYQHGILKRSAKQLGQELERDQYLSEDRMLVFFYLLIAFKLYRTNSFRASACIARLLLQLPVHEARCLYEALRPSFRDSDDSEYARQKKLGYDEVVKRLGGRVKTETRAHNDKSFVPHDCPGELRRLAEECWERFTPWTRDKCPLSGQVDDLSQLDPVWESESEAAEQSRMHIVFHCLEKFADMVLDKKTEMLIPQFVLATPGPNLGGPLGQRLSPPPLNLSDHQEAARKLEEARLRRRKTLETLLQCKIDGRVEAEIDLRRESQSMTMTFSAEDDCLEVWANDVLLATYFLPDAETLSEGESMTQFIEIEGGQQLVCNFAVVHDSAGEATSLTAQVKYRETKPLRVAVRLWQCFKYQVAEKYTFELQRKQRDNFNTPLAGKTDDNPWGTPPPHAETPLSATGNSASTRGAALLDPRLWLLQWVGAALAILLLGLFIITSINSAAKLHDIRSVAVLPIATADAAYKYLGAGIPEGIINRLSPLPSLKVVRGSVLDLKRSGRDLNAQAVLTGDLVRQGADLSIRVALVSTADGSHLWERTFVSKLSDPGAVEEEMASKIANALQLNLTGEEQRLLTKRYTLNPEAYHRYLEGRYFWNQRTDENYEKAIDKYDQAIKLDPNFALAYAGKADAYALLYDEPLKRDPARSNAEQFARKAISLDSQLAEPYATLGFLAIFRDQNWAEAEENFNRAKELNRGYETAYHWHAIMLAMLGRFEEALDEIKRAKEIAPRSFPINKDFGEILFYARRYDEAIAQIRQTVEIEPNNDNVETAQLWIRNAYERKGDLESAVRQLELTRTGPEVIAELRQALRQGGENGYWQKRLEILARTDPDSPNRRMRMVFLNAAAGRIEQALSMLKRSVEEDHHDQTVYMKVDPRYDNLRSDPRFTRLLQALKLPM